MDRPSASQLVAVVTALVTLVLAAPGALAQATDTDTLFSNALSLRAEGDLTGALTQAEAAAVRGHVRAAVLAGDLLELTEGADNVRRAVEYYRIAAGANDADALFRLGLLASEGRGGLSEAMAASFFGRAAEAGRAEAQYEQAQLYLDPASPLYNPEYGAQLLRRAAMEGVTAAQLDLGLALAGGGAEEGAGTRAPPPREAAQWLIMAADAGDPDAAYAAGLVYAERGEIAAARELYARAADAGHVQAAADLGWMLYREYAVAHRVCGAEYSARADVADCRAQIDKGAWREGVERLREAAIFGDPVGRFRYAWALAEGGPDDVLAQDLESAYRWILLAEAAGIADYGAANDAAKIKAWLETKLDPDLIESIADTPLFADDE